MSQTKRHFRYSLYQLPFVFLLHDVATNRFKDESQQMSTHKGPSPQLGAVPCTAVHHGWMQGECKGDRC